MDRLDFSFEEGEEALKRSKNRTRRADRRICVCGHGARSHTSESDSDIHKSIAIGGRFACLSGRMECPCKKFYPVASTTDVRRFICKTTGAGPDHALSKGIISARARAMEEGKTEAEANAATEWLPGVGCFKCLAVDVPLTPVALNGSGNESDVPTPNNFLLCSGCRRAARDAANQRVVDAIAAQRAAEAAEAERLAKRPF